MTQRPFRILGIQHVAIGAADKSRLRRLWMEMLGANIVETYRSERENVDEDIAAIGSGHGRFEVDLMQPVDPANKPS